MIVIDTECYKNYWLLSAKQLSTGKVANFELYPGHPLDKGIDATLKNYTSISFNGNGYDLPMIAAALKGYDNAQLKALSDRIIKGSTPAWRLAKELDLYIPSGWDHIDVMEVSPGRVSLKIYGGRLGAPRLQDLPISPDDEISEAQREELRTYCVNDLDTTEMLYNQLRQQISLREKMGDEYGMDLRSKSDAQIAETVIKSELQAMTGKQYRAPKLPDDYSFKYQNPKIISFVSPELKAVGRKIMQTPFGLGGNGAVKLPQWLKDTRLVIGQAEYQMGVGGLHSCEKSQHVKADSEHLLFELDVASYYPAIILQQKLAPESLGAPFLRVYQSIVTRRLKAKREGDKVTADTLKIAVNGSFGKLGSKYSALYAPDLLVQTTMTGQLALLMLIERLELKGIRVVSANTDGVVVLCNKRDEDAMREIAWHWELDTSYMLERTDYSALASRDVNNYVAVTTCGKMKPKGVFAKPGIAKNPDTQIVYDAVAGCIANNTPIAETIRACDDVLKFVTVRRVQGGAVWRGELLGKAVRFYYSTSVAEDECIHYATNSNRVPKSAGAKPLMELPPVLPEDIDYSAYIVAAEKLLCEVGYRA